MKNMAVQKKVLSPDLEYGQVVAVVREHFEVETEFGPVRAEQAVSCLVRPQPGDRILVSMDSEGTCFILAVLRRTGIKDSGVDLDLAGPLRVRARGGGISLATDQDLNLTAGQDLGMISDRLSVKASEAEVAVDRASWVGRIVELQAETIRTVAGAVEHVLHTLTQRLFRSFRYVKDHEEIQTGSSRHLVEDTLTTHSKNAVHMAEEIVKINAEQVHLG